MYVIFTIIYHKNQPNVGKYTIGGSYGYGCGLYIFFGHFTFYVGPITMTITHHVPWKTLRFFHVFFFRTSSMTPFPSMSGEGKIEVGNPLEPCQGHQFSAWHHDLPGKFLTCERVRSENFRGQERLVGLTLGMKLLYPPFYLGDCKKSL